MAKTFGQLPAVASPASADLLAIEDVSASLTGSLRLDALASWLAGVIPPSIDHGALTGLADDDHTQYHNDTRGDARYLATATPLAPADAGVVGTSTKLARQDHVHPIGSNVTKALTANAVVNFNSSMTATQIQALINAQPKNLNGYQTTFLFGDGTYSLDTMLLFTGFYGGNVIIRGNAADTSLSQTKSVILEFTASFSTSVNTAIRIENCDFVQFNYLHVRALKAAKLVNVLNSITCYVGGCYFESYDTSAGMYGLETAYCSTGAYVQNTYFKYGRSALYSHNGGFAYSTNNASDATYLPQYGLHVVAGVIVKSGAQPSGSIANELATTGGQIWS